MYEIAAASVMSTPRTAPDLAAGEKLISLGQNTQTQNYRQNFQIQSGSRSERCRMFHYSRKTPPRLLIIPEPYPVSPLYG